MVRLPWRRDSSDAEDEELAEGDVSAGDTTASADEEREPDPAEADADDVGDPTDEDPLLACQFQDGKLSVYDDVLHIERASGSKFSDKWIPLTEVTGVTYTERLLIHYIQIQQRGVDNDEEGFLSTPVDENTLHLGHGKRDCARKARDTILERTGT